MLQTKENRPALMPRPLPPQNAGAVRVAEVEQHGVEGWLFVKWSPRSSVNHLL